MPKISQLPDSSVPLTGEEYLVLDQVSVTLSGSVTVTTKTQVKNLPGSPLMFHGAKYGTEAFFPETGLLAPVSFGPGEYDTDGFFDISDPTVLTVPFDGFYLVQAQSYWTALGPSVNVELTMQIAGVFSLFKPTSQQYFSDLLGDWAGYAASIYECSAGDQFRLLAQAFPVSTAAAFSMCIAYLGVLPPPPPPPPLTADALIADGSTTISVSGSDALLWE